MGAPTPRNDTLAERLAVQDALDERIGRVDRARATGSRSPTRCAPRACRRPRWRGPRSASTTTPAPREWGLWPTVHHREMGDVRVDGIPVHLSETDWVDRAGRPVPRRAQRPGASELLGLDDAEIEQLAKDGVM